jgi:EAL domain-containing protein (putative c-di-GMP-specific phosphodiesterase class I)
LAHAFDMTTVAEGVETQAQLDYLTREGCDESQGYLHSRPVAKAEFERLLGVSRPAPGDAVAPIAYINADAPASRTRRA